MKRLIYIILMLSCMLFVVYLEHQVLLKEKRLRERDKELAESVIPKPEPDERITRPEVRPERDTEMIAPGDSFIPGLIHEQGVSLQVNGEYIEAVRLFEMVATRYSDHLLAEDSVMRIAFCWTALGLPDQAAYTLQYFVYRYPDSKYAPEVRSLLRNSSESNKVIA